MAKKKTRMTKQRKAILETLKNTDCHPTADWIYNEVKDEIPNISLGTVYRNLNFLAEQDEIMVLDYGSTHSRYDGTPEQHYHFHCQECDNVYDIHLDLKENLNKQAEEATPFKINEHRLEYYGICDKCQNS